MDHIGERVRARRQALGLTQEALARRADVSLNLINRVERGETRDPHYSTLVAIAHALDTSVGVLLREEGIVGLEGYDPKAPAPSSPSPAEDEERREAEMMGQLAEELREFLIEDLAQVPLEQLSSLYEALPEGILRGAVERARARVSARTGIWGGWEETPLSARQREERERDEAPADEVPGAEAG